MEWEWNEFYTGSEKTWVLSFVLSPSVWWEILPSANSLSLQSELTSSFQRKFGKKKKKRERNKERKEESIAQTQLLKFLAYSLFIFVQKFIQGSNQGTLAFSDVSDGRESTCNAGDLGLISGLGKSFGEGKGNPLQYSCLENPTDGGACWATVHGVTKSGTRVSDFTHF